GYFCFRVTDDGLQTRAHLETQLAASLALKSAQEYRQCLLSYVRFLAREADESRLREVCESFLGPPVGMVGSVSSTDPKNPVWDPYVLEMKKHKLLKEDILPSMASNRKVQRLLNEFMDLLSEYEAADTKDDPMDVTPVPPTTEGSDKVMQPTTTEDNDKVMQPATEASDKVMQPATEANDKFMQAANDAGNKVVQPATDAGDKVMQPATDAGDRVMQPAADAGDKVMQPTPEANGEMMTS
ncbi:unnamed protein product, partial [Urochloa humidicola]